MSRSHASKLKLFIVIAIFVFRLSNALADDLAFSQNARTFETQHSSLMTKGVAHACLGLTTMPDGLPCNPASITRIKRPSFGFVALVSNGYSSVDAARKLLDNKISQDVVDSFFTKNRVLQLEGNVDLNFKSPKVNVQYTPVTLKAFSVARNEADPEVQLYVMQESGFTVQTGVELTRELSVGVQARILKRKFVRKRFKLTALGTQAGQDLLKPNEQSTTYFEPAATYEFSTTWRPRVSVMVANLGYVSQKYDDLPTPIEPQCGLAISPPLQWGDLDLTLESRSMNYLENAQKKLRAGAMYHFGSMYLTTGVDFNGLSAGVYFDVEKVNAGILYSTTRYFNDDDSFYTQTVYVQLGWLV